MSHATIDRSIGLALALMLLLASACGGDISIGPEIDRTRVFEPGIPGVPLPSTEAREAVDQRRRDIADELMRVAMPLKSRIGVWLANRQFEEVERALHAMLERTERREISETTLRAVVRYVNWSASSSPSAHPETLGRWVADRPDAWAAHLSLGIHEAQLGFTARGGKFSGETPDQHFERMREHFEVAKREFARTIELEPRVLVSYEELLKIARARGDQEACQRWASEAERVDPLNYHVRVRLQYCLTPRWGGSYASMREAATSALEHADANPSLRLLGGYELMDRADIALRAGKLKSAMDLTNLALAYGTQPSWIGKRADLHMKNRNFDAAIADRSVALEFEPDRSLHRRRRARAHGAKGDIEAALVDLDQVIRGAPKYAPAFRDRAWVYEQKGEGERAKLDREIAANLEAKRNAEARTPRVP